MRDEGSVIEVAGETLSSLPPNHRSLAPDPWRTANSRCGGGRRRLPPRNTEKSNVFRGDLLRPLLVDTTLRLPRPWPLTSDP